MVETRAAPRHRVMKPAQIGYGGEKYACTLRDVSTTGAALQLHHVMQTPDNFILLVPEDGLELVCRLVWRSGLRLGVAFE
jgi:PilZ domain-containing protein